MPSARRCIGWFRNIGSYSKHLCIAEFQKATRTFKLQTVAEEQQRDSSQTESQCQDRKEASSKEKHKDSKNKIMIKDKARLRSAS